MSVYEFLCKHCHRKFSKILTAEKAEGNKINCPYCGSDDVEKR